MKGWGVIGGIEIRTLTIPPQRTPSNDLLDAVDQAQILIQRWSVIPNTVVRSSAMKCMGSINNTSLLTKSVNEILVYIFDLCLKMSQCLEIRIWLEILTVCWEFARSELIFVAESNVSTDDPTK